MQLLYLLYFSISDGRSVLCVGCSIRSGRERQTTSSDEGSV